MDFLDPKRQRAHTIRLIVGYILLGIVILIGTVILLYQAYGFTLNDQGKIIQNGLVFVSSSPAGGKVLIDGVQKTTTNTRLELPSGSYGMQVARDGYGIWKRTITVEGGTVVRFPYPILFPSHLVTANTKSYANSPLLMTESPNHRWLMLETNVLGVFDRFDLTASKQQPTSVVIPDGLLTPATKTQDLSVIAWANDNRHILMRHDYDGTYEYILFDTQSPGNSVNLSKNIGLNTTSTLTLNNGAYDHYFVYDAKTTVLSTAVLGNATITPVLQYVVAYQAADPNDIIYVTLQGAPTGKARVMLYQGGVSYLLRTVTQSSSYLLALQKFSGSWYVAAGVTSENRVYVYQDPVSILQNDPSTVLIPVHILQVTSPTSLSFSPSGQYVVAENALGFATYDAQYDKGYSYTLTVPMDAPQQTAAWIDGAHMSFVSNGKVYIFDYDGANQRALEPADSQYTPVLDQATKYIYAIADVPNSTKTATTPTLTNTALLIPADQ